MKLSVESRDQGFGSTTSNESSLNESIDDLKLSPEKKDELKKILQQSDQTDKQKSDFIAKLKSADPAVADTAISFLKMRPDANLTAVGVVTEKLSAELSTQGSPVEQLVEEQGDDVFDTLYKVAEEDEANVDESLKALQSPNGYAAQYSTKAMNAVNMLHTVMSGGQLANPHLQQTFEKYASAPNPFAALSTDLNAVESLNSQFSGTGTFTLRDLGEMNLDSTSGVNGQTDDISNIGKAFAALEPSNEFNSTEKVKGFVQAYKNAGGKDVAGALSQLPEVEAGLGEIKKSLGLRPQDPLLEGYKNSLMSSLATGVAQGNVDEIIAKEASNIKSAYPVAGNATMSKTASNAYQSSGFSKEAADHPLGDANAFQTTPQADESAPVRGSGPSDNVSALNQTPDSSSSAVDNSQQASDQTDPTKPAGSVSTPIRGDGPPEDAADQATTPEDNSSTTAPEDGGDTAAPEASAASEVGANKPVETAETVARPGSAQNSGSKLGDIVVPSLSENKYAKYDDIKDSPLYNEQELQQEFGGDVEAYAKYLAQAHYLLEEELGVTPDQYKEGGAEGGLSLKNVKMYLINRGYDPETLTAEIKYIKDTKAHLQSTADSADVVQGEKGVDANNPNFTSFDPKKYIQSGGEGYDVQMPKTIVRPKGQFDNPEVIPKWVSSGLQTARQTLDGSVSLIGSQQSYNQREQSAQQDVLAVIRPYGSQPDSQEEISLTDEEKTKVRVAEKERLRAGNMQEYITERTKNLDKTKSGDNAAIEDYYTADGELKKAYDSNGNVLKNEKGQPMSLIEFEAIQKYAGPELAKELISNHKDLDIDISTAGGFESPSSKELASSLTEYRKDFEFRPVNVEAKKESEIALNTHEAASKEITAIGDTITTKIEDANEQLKRFNDMYEEVMDALVKAYTEQVEMLKNTFQYLPI